LSKDVEIRETDKPFILALVSSGITILSIVVAAIGAYTGNTYMKDTGIEVLKYTGTLTTMSWTYYFSKKE